MASRSADRSSGGGRGARPVQAAFVLHQHDWSESSLVIEAFSRDTGRLVLVAKGAKRPYSQMRAVLLPFQRLHIVVGTKRGEEHTEVHTLRSAEWAGGPPMLAGAALLSGFYLNELLLKALPRQDAHPLLFDAYAWTLQALGATADAATQPVLRAFELVLLRELGMLPQLDQVTLTQQPVAPDHAHALHPEHGVVPWSGPVARQAAEGLTGASLQAVQRALDAQDLLALQRVAADCLAPLRTQLRHLLHHALGTDRLLTRQVMLDGQRLQTQPLPRPEPTP